MCVWLIKTSLITGTIFLSFCNFRYRRGTVRLNSINILAQEKCPSGKSLPEVTVTYNFMHAILWALNNERYGSVLFCDLVRHFWLEIMTVLFDEQIGLCSELYHNDGKQGPDIYSLKSHFNWNWGIVKHALPKGSILGHMLFLMYIQYPKTETQFECFHRDPVLGNVGGMLLS